MDIRDRFSGFGHDKSRATAPYRDLPHKPTLFFCGDGVSDLSAGQWKAREKDFFCRSVFLADARPFWPCPTARASDLLFVKVIPGHTNDLKVHCDREGIPYLPFEQFVEVKDPVADVVEGRRSIQDLLAAKN